MYYTACVVVILYIMAVIKKTLYESPNKTLKEGNTCEQFLVMCNTKN